MLLFPQFIKSKTFKLLWNIDITWGLVWDLKEINFERGFRMDIVLEVSEIEDHSQFPNIEIQTVEITSKYKQGTQHREGRSFASEVRTAEKATQAISRKVWRKTKRKEHLKEKNACETTTRSTSSGYSKGTSRVHRKHEEVWKTTRRKSQERKSKVASRSSTTQGFSATKRKGSVRGSRRI